MKQKQPTTQVTVKAILNAVQRFPGFVYRRVRLVGTPRRLRIEVGIEAHAQSALRCGQCQRRCPGYDRLPERRWAFVPLWKIPVDFFYAPRRVRCPEHGVVVEYMPWSEGKRPIARAMMSFLALWARRLSWRETARAFGTSWEAVYRSVAWFVDWGLGHRKLAGVEAIGVDEIHWGKGLRSANFLTLIYQIDRNCRRLLWVGPRRTQASLRRGLKALGPEVVSGLRFVCSDLWKPYLNVIARQAGHALHVLDRFHITLHLNQALDQVRRSDVARLHGQDHAKCVKHLRWKLLRRRRRLRGRARLRIATLVLTKMATGRAWLFKEVFQHLWHYRSPLWAQAFLHGWCAAVMRSRIEPMKRVARMLRAHEPYLLNWFRAKGEISNGVVEGLNNKIRVVTRRSYGFRTYPAMEVALYHTLGRLPEPEFTHRFC